MAKANGAAQERWSPYGHEPYRRAAIRRRQRSMVLAALGLAAAYLLFGYLTQRIESDLSTPSRVGVGDTHKPQKPTRVTIEPGRATFSETAVGGVPAASAPPTRAPPPDPTLKQVMPVLKAASPVLVAYYLLSRINTVPRGRLAEVNFGVFKGAMPFELISASARDRVFNFHEAGESVFGKEREDYVTGRWLEAPTPEIRRLLGERPRKPVRVVRIVAAGRRPEPQRATT